MGKDPSTAITIGGVNCWIVEDRGVVESWGSEGFRAEVTYRCAWADRLALAVGLRGTITASGSKMVYTPAHRYPDATGLACTALGPFVPEKLRRRASDNWAEYEWVQIPAIYTVPNWTEGGQWPNIPLFTKVTFNTSPEVFSPPGGAFYIPTLSGMPVPDSSLGIVRPHCEITLTRSYLPYPPVWADLFFQGTVSSTDMQFGDRTFPAGCLLYMGMSAEPQSDPSTGAQKYECAFKFLGNYEITFNEFFAPDGLWHVLNSKADGTGFPPFDSEDFNWFLGNDLAPPAAALTRVDADFAD